MAELFDAVPDRLQGLWQRTHLEIRSPSPLVGDRPVRVFWLQSHLWHADLRIPLDRPDFSGVQSIADCSDDELRAIAGTEAFAGITRISGPICTWLRLHEMFPGTALDVGRMRFDGSVLVEEGVGGEYLEHWERIEATEAARAPSPAPPRRLEDGRIVLACGPHVAVIVPRPAPTPAFDPYQPLDALDRAGLEYRAGFEITLYENRAEGVVAIASTLPWREGTTLDTTGTDWTEIASCA